MTRQRVITYPSAATRADSSPPAGGSSGFFDFTAMAAEDPLSAGGVWTNNTAGTGGNAVMGSLSSIRVAAAASGGQNIACGDALGQSSPPAAGEYRDSFAFVPGFPGNQRITAVVYRDPSYEPVANHEIELIVGCKILSADHFTWVEANTGALGGAQLISFINTGAGGFNILTPSDTGAHNIPWATGDVWVAELHRASNEIRTYINGALRLSYTDATLVAQLGDGIGVASFRRTAEGLSTANAFGFLSVDVEAF